MIQTLCPDKGEYKTVVLGYFDILGFRDFLKNNCKNSPDSLLKIIAPAVFISKMETSVSLLDIESRIMSDSIVIWSENIENGLQWICNVASLIQNTLLKRGLLVRGGIVLGNHFCKKLEKNDHKNISISESDDVIIISPALVKAVEIEKKISYPQIVLENNDELLKLVKSRDLPVHCEDEIFSIDGWFSSHELKALAHNLDSSAYEVMRKTKEIVANDNKMRALEELKDIKIKIENSINSQDCKIKEKWNFILNKYNSFIKSCPNNNEFIDLLLPQII